MKVLHSASLVLCVTDRHALPSVSVSYLILPIEVGNLHITCRFLVSCLQVWRELFSPLHALNFGIGGDTTCNVLWRLQNGELENIRPKVTQVY